jgi:hypothetical protein
MESIGRDPMLFALSRTAPPATRPPPRWANLRDYIEPVNQAERTVLLRHVIGRNQLCGRIESVRISGLMAGVVISIGDQQITRAAKAGTGAFRAD